MNAVHLLGGRCLELVTREGQPRDDDNHRLQNGNNDRSSTINRCSTGCLCLTAELCRIENQTGLTKVAEGRPKGIVLKASSMKIFAGNEDVDFT
jgi:hypothetical protein